MCTILSMTLISLCKV